jgi:hypothetical protein
MTYPPPGGGENQQYHLQPEPHQPSDPYTQGYNSTPPPPGNYYQQPSQPQYTQPQSQPMMMPPQVGVQPGYPSVPGSVLPPPVPPPKQGGSLGIILGVVVVLVVVLGVAAVLIIPGLVNDDDDPSAGGGGTTSEEASPEETESEPEATEEEPTAEDEPAADDDFATWGTAASSDDFDPNTPEGAAITYMAAANSGDDAALEAAVCADPSSDMAWDLDWELDGDGEQLDVTFWGVSREMDGETQAWSGTTTSGEAPASQADLESLSAYFFTVVEEEGQWKVCHIWQDY